MGRRGKLTLTQYIREHSLIDTQFYCVAYCLPHLPHQPPGPSCSTTETITVFPGSLPHWSDSSPTAEALSNLNDYLEDLPQCLAHSCSIKACYIELKLRALTHSFCTGQLQGLPRGNHLALELLEVIIFRLGYLHNKQALQPQIPPYKLLTQFVALCRLSREHSFIRNCNYQHYACVPLQCPSPKISRKTAKLSIFSYQRKIWKQTFFMHLIISPLSKRLHSLYPFFHF